jgi:hypothetical protein
MVLCWLPFIRVDHAAVDPSLGKCILQ